MALTTPARVQVFSERSPQEAAEAANTFLGTLPNGLAIHVQATENLVDGNPWYTLLVAYELVDPTEPAWLDPEDPEEVGK
ncbi:MAG: hypothetical protein K6U87_09815 [Firmicutes bacterium]|nr:hypothetical protein [Bacillota bacterium]